MNDNSTSLRDRAVVNGAGQAGSALRAAVPSARRRNWRGQFIKQMRLTPECDRVWLIWSKKWGRWHMRGSDGGARGYTDDITRAGFFPYSKAAEYNDGWDNTVFHVSEKEDALRREIARMEAALADFRDAVAQAIEAGTGETVGLDPKGESAVLGGNAP